MSLPVKTKAEFLKGSRRPMTERLADLRSVDPAEALLGLRIADPAMGSGHFLVSIVDWLADSVLLAMEEAAVVAKLDGGVEDYTSPLADRIEAERFRIETAAKAHGRGPIFTWLIFSRASLLFTNLSGSNLEGANFSEANLAEVDLTEAKLDGTNFTRARVWETFSPPRRMGGGARSRRLDVAEAATNPHNSRPH